MSSPKTGLLSRPKTGLLAALFLVFLADLFLVCQKMIEFCCVVALLRQSISRTIQKELFLEFALLVPCSGSHVSRPVLLRCLSKLLAFNRNSWELMALLPSEQKLGTILAWVVLPTPSSEESCQLPTCGFILVAPKIFGCKSALCQMLVLMQFWHDMPVHRIISSQCFSFQGHVLCRHSGTPFAHVLQIICFCVMEHAPSTSFQSCKSSDS